MASTKRFNVFTKPAGKPMPLLVGEAIQNSDGVISIRMVSVPIGFDGRLTLTELVAPNVVKR